MKTTIIVIISFLLFGFVNTTSYAQNEKGTLKILFVGNSYTYFKNLPQMVSIISDNTKTKLVTKKSTKGSAKLREHWLGERGLKTKDGLSILCL
jgi:uncharacterized membrane protein